MIKKKQYNSDYKSKVALEAIRGELTINEISSKYGVHSSQINRWKAQALLSIKSCFKGQAEKAIVSNERQVDDLYRQIGQLTCENEFLKKSAWR